MGGVHLGEAGEKAPTDALSAAAAARNARRCPRNMFGCIYGDEFNALPAPAASVVSSIDPCSMTS